MLTVLILPASVGLEIPGECSHFTCRVNSVPCSYYIGTYMIPVLLYVMSSPFVAIYIYSIRMCLNSYNLALLIEFH